MATSGKRTSSSKKSTTKKKTINKQQAAKDVELFHEIELIVFFVAMVFLFFCNFGIIGSFGNAISGFLFGLFGLTAYIAPIFLFFSVAFGYANRGSGIMLRKLLSAIVLFLMAGVVCDLISNQAVSLSVYDFKGIYSNCKEAKNGGGILAGSIAYFLNHYLETIGTVLVVFLISAICIILLTEKSILNGVKNGGSIIKEKTQAEAERRRENAKLRQEAYEEQRVRRDEERMQREEERNRRNEERMQKEEARRQKEEERKQREEEKRLREEEKENEKILRMDKRVSGVMLDTALKKNESEKKKDGIHEITFNDDEIEELEEKILESSVEVTKPTFDFDKINVRSSHTVNTLAVEEEVAEEIQKADDYSEEVEDNIDPQPIAAMSRDETKAVQKPVMKPQNMSSSNDSFMHATQSEQIKIHKEDIEEPAAANANMRPVAKLSENNNSNHNLPEMNQNRKPAKTYMFPPLSRLQKGVAASGDSTQELKETAMRLQQTLNTFGVKVTITDISQGPSVTRYELQPEQGVKVSKIVGLADDIKLNLAATDIRIEAPIPGKAAIGIEVPNKENMMVALRDLFESKEFKEFPSNIAFAVGKDIAGKTIVTDIGKMPHMLIAGSTGSGKSVCINTIIMSVLYKAHPDDVKLIMVDPKVVELSVYNGIPHLLIPVVTDPKKASAALHWGVSEMEDRYRKFADFNVRDLKGYNQKLESMRESGEENVPPKLPQIIIIVDELADLMMVCPGEVEESICRLAQLARAAGIHLIIATQRPSVDVITGLIKANMPSRVAFAVSSGVDSRTILDMNGAEKLLGKGDMLFYPQGYSKPARIQGAFVSDKEVSDVVDFLKNQMIGNTYAEDIEEKIKNMGSSSSSAGGGTSSDNERDEYFAEAGRFIIDKDKASIGMLQRVFKIGFNRAARIMDQLCDYGVVGEEEGTKPRKVLMTMEQFEQFLEEI